MTLPRLPPRALPLAIRVVRAVRVGIVWRIGDLLIDLEHDLRCMVEPATVDDLWAAESKPPSWRGTPLDIVVDPNLGAFDVVDVDLTPPDRTCFECGTSDPTGFCPAHRVLDKGRAN